MSEKRTVRWIGDQTYLGTNKSGKAILMSDGNGPGVGPLETLLFGLSSCSMYDVVTILRKQRQDLQEFHVEVDGERAEEGARPYKNIQMHFVFKGALDEKKVARAIDLSTTKYCGAYATLSGVADITTSYEIRNDD
jgi:putative redox protein